MKARKARIRVILPARPRREGRWVAATVNRESFVARMSDARFGIVTAGMAEDQAEGFTARLRHGLAVSLPDGTTRAMDTRVAHALLVERGAAGEDILSAAEDRFFETYR